MEFGELPEGWSKATVGEVATLFRGVTYSKDQASNTPQIGMKPILRGNNINGELNFDDFVYVPEALIAPEQLISAGDIIFAMSSGSKHLVGKSAKARISFDGGFGAFCGLLRATEAINKDFLHYVFQGSDFRRAISEVSKGSNINNLKREHILDFEFSCPPLAEQHRIVAKIEELFSELDQGMASLKTAREQLKVYRQSLLKNAFEGKLTAAWRAAHADQLEPAAALQQRIARERETRHQQQLADWQNQGKPGPKPKAPKPLPPLTTEELAELPELPAGWGWFKLAGVSDVSGGLTKNQKREQLSATRPYLRVANVYANRLELDEVHSIGVTDSELERVALEKGDLLIVEGNGSIDQIGRVALWLGQISGCVHQNHIIKARPLKLATSKFLLYFLMSELGRKFIVRAASSTSGLHTLSISKVEGLFVPLCSGNEQAEVIAELESKLSEANQLDQTLATALQQADALRQAILKKAFCGQLVKQDKNDEPATALLERIRAERTASPARGWRAKLGSKPLPNC